MQQQNGSYTNWNMNHLVYNFGPTPTSSLPAWTGDVFHLHHRGRCVGDQAAQHSELIFFSSLIWVQWKTLSSCTTGFYWAIKAWTSRLWTRRFRSTWRAVASFGLDIRLHPRRWTSKGSFGRRCSVCVFLLIINVSLCLPLGLFIMQLK